MEPEAWDATTQQYLPARCCSTKRRDFQAMGPSAGCDWPSNLSAGGELFRRLRRGREAASRQECQGCQQSTSRPEAVDQLILMQCQARSEDAWPKTETEFYAVSKLAGQVCESTQTGSAKYDPSTDGRYCGWQGPEEMEEGETRCSQATDSGTYRFCPCNSDKEL
eukprot:g15737.t1